MRKILYSPGFGAGWSTWMDVPTKFSCEYAPIISAIERGEKLNEDHPAVIQFVADCKELYKENAYLGGIGDLRIFNVPEGEVYRIEEYDGAESVQLRSMTEWY